MATHFVRPGPDKIGPRLTSRGTVFLLAALAAIIAGAVFQLAVVFQLGAFSLVVFFVAWFLARSNTKGLEITRTTPSEVFAMQDFTIQVNLRNHKRRLDSFSLEIEDALLPYANRGLQAPWIRARGTCQMEFATRQVKRGVLDRASITIRSAFPFGLFRVEERRRLPLKVTVYPRSVTPKALEHEYDSDFLEGNHESVRTRDPSGDFHGLREYQNGDRIKLIHWPASARMGRPLVRELDRPIPEKYSIVFHSFCPAKNFIWPEAFEISMELLAGLLHYCQNQEVPMDLTASFNEWRTVNISDPRDLKEPLTLLAHAQHKPESTVNPLVRVLQQLPGHHSVFVFSETPVSLWAPLLPPLPRHLTCLDNADVQVRAPIFG